ncbi:MAG: hypothetical protein WKF75_12825 [Singulisphaera sp.]
MPIITLKNTSGWGPLIDVLFFPSDPLADALREAGRPVPLPVVSLVSGCHQVIASDLGSLGVRALIGRDLLNRCHLVYNGPHDEFTLSF